ncbi:unnamed protein product, partial [Didymodactylos carnosus]
TKENACIKKFALSPSYVEEECDGKCLKAYEKIEARTKEELLKDERTPTIRKCVSQTELEHLQSIKITTKSGCHTIRTTKTKHKVILVILEHDNNEKNLKAPKNGRKSTKWQNLRTFKEVSDRTFTYTILIQQGRTYIVAVPDDKIKSNKIKQVSNAEHYSPRTNKKSFLTNSDKSVFNLKWEVGGTAEKHYQRSRGRLVEDNREVSPKQPDSGRRVSHHYIQTDKPQILINPPPVYYYPYAYPPPMIPHPVYYDGSHLVPPPPPEPVMEHTTTQVGNGHISQRMLDDTSKIHPTLKRNTIKQAVKQSDKSINLIRGFDKIKVKHHYVDSPEKVKELMQSLQNKGYVRSGIQMDEDEDDDD